MGCVEGDYDWCDGRDNDCDGIIDEGHPCPSADVSNTLPVTGVVMAVIPEPTDEDRIALRRIWPDRSDTVGDFDHDSSGSVSPAGPGRYTYRSRSNALYEWRMGADVEVDTPPCFYEREWFFDYDGAGTIYYVCDGTLRRGLGELVVPSFPGEGTVYRVTESGRALFREVSRPYEPTWLGTAGVHTAIDFGQWSGRFWHAVVHPTVVGDSVFHVMHRDFRGTSRHEKVIFRLDAGEETALLVRRVPALDFSNQRVMALPDGTLLMWWPRGERPNQNVLAIPTDGPAYKLYEGPLRDVIYVPAP